ncbi:MAG: gentisate 1,2-dioxygenase [Gammaproteobacteria bacterium]|nr:gentisate 1,2-dioxygenase [Gammaproteobacteria bacterium]
MENDQRRAYYERISPDNLTPLWSVLGNLVTPQPGSGCLPHLWRYATVRQHLMEAGELITAKEAERRVLILENPGLRGQSRITTSLYAGLQLVKPGEVAPAHRHTQSALRFVIEGSGAHTAVGGEKTRMEPGDFVITPNWQWHDHGNESTEPMIWLDGLDIPLVQFLDASFAEKLDTDEQPISRPEGDAMARFGEGLLPVDHQKVSATSPIFNYPYGRTREALELMRRDQQWDACHGLKMRYVNPVTGDFAMPTIGTFMQLLPGGFDSTPYRSTDATVFVAVEGQGHSVIGDQRFDWQEKDIFVVPSWSPVTHHTAGDAVLFSYSDRPVQQKLDLWRERRG